MLFVFIKIIIIRTFIIITILFLNNVAFYMQLLTPCSSDFSLSSMRFQSQKLWNEHNETLVTLCSFHNFWCHPQIRKYFANLYLCNAFYETGMIYYRCLANAQFYSGCYFTVELRLIIISPILKYFSISSHLLDGKGLLIFSTRTKCWARV